MKTKFLKSTLTVIIIVFVQNCFSQSFLNLNFESAVITLAGGPGDVYASNAIPHWSAYFGPTGNPTNSSLTGLAIIGYNGVSLGGAIVSIQDTNAISFSPIQGTYSVLLQGSIPAAASTASIGQTGTIPVTAKSLTCWGYLSTVSFGGQPLPLVQLSSTANYNVYGADISAYAGLTGQLLFTAPIQNAVLLDNIQFSSSQVPEPSSLSILGVGALLLGLRRSRNSKR